MPDGMSLPNFEAAIIFILGAFTLLVAVDKGVEAFSNLFLRKRKKQEATQSERLLKIENQLAEHEQRLDRWDQKFDSLSGDMTQTLNVLNAILMHEITGNGVEKLKSVKSELDVYMASRK